MEKYHVAINVGIEEELITTGIYPGDREPKIGAFVEIEATDENGMPYDEGGEVVEVLS